MTKRKKKGPPRRRPLDVLFESEAWLVVDKPAGIPVHGGAGKTGPSILERLAEERGLHLHLAHRLDRGTAGVLVLAKQPDGAREASEAWPDAVKTYEAVTAGGLVPRTITTPLRDPDGRARSAHTEVIAADGLELAGLTLSLATIRIQTGRLHQIRRHLGGIQHPVLGDDKHGDFELNRRFVEAARSAGLPRPKHLLLRCASVEVPARLGLPLVSAPRPRGWEPLLQTGAAGDAASERGRKAVDWGSAEPGA